MWTRESLSQLVQDKLSGYLFLVVSNREPYIHTFSGGKIECQMPVSGVTVALDPAMRACGGIWIACGSGDADKIVVDSYDQVRVPPENPQYTLQRVWLSKEEEEGYYYGFSNKALWPLCHVAFVSPKFSSTDWDIYRRVNQLFAKTVLQQVGDHKAIVFIQDYHLALLSRLIKQQNPEIITAHFWHIPWPNYQLFRICPWQEEILHGLLGNDLLGFHTQYYCSNFLETVEHTLESRVDHEKNKVMRGENITWVRPFPIGVDAEQLAKEANTEGVREEMRRIRSELRLEGKYVGIGMDRVDYTKGIPERLMALDKFFEKYPEYRGKTVFVELGMPSRTQIGEYQEINDRIDRLIEEINRKYEYDSWKPIIYVKGKVAPQTLSAFRRIADFCIVSSLHVNPYAIDEFAEAIKEALEMPQQERKQRMKQMRAIVMENNIYHWSASIISEILKLQSKRA